MYGLAHHNTKQHIIHLQWTLSEKVGVNEGINWLTNDFCTKTKFQANVKGERFYELRVFP